MLRTAPSISSAGVIHGLVWLTWSSIGVAPSSFGTPSRPTGRADRAHPWFELRRPNERFEWALTRGTEGPRHGNFDEKKDFIRSRVRRIHHPTIPSIPAVRLLIFANAFFFSA